MRIAARLVLAGALAATPYAEPTASAAAESPECSIGAAASLGEIGCELASAVFGLAPGAAVIGLTPEASAPASLRPELAVRLAVRVATALGSGAAAWPYVESQARAHSLPHGPRPLVLVGARLEGDRLVVAAEVVGPESTTAGGDRKGATLGRFVARRQLDAEVRAFLPPVRFAVSELKPLEGSDPSTLALACADVRREGPPVVVTLSRDRVTVGSLDGSRYTRFSERRLSELVGIASAPLREPIATAAFTGQGEVLLGISDRANAVRLPLSLEGPARALASRLPWPGGGCAGLEGLFVSPRPERCAKTEPVLAQPAPREPLDALAGALLTSRFGKERLVRAGRRASDGSATLVDAEREIRLERAGAQLAVGDLDGDGSPELVSSVDTDDPLLDAVVVHSWLDSGLKEQLRVAVPTGVRALAVCPARTSTFSPILVASSRGVWVLR